jgi:membrane-associated phospholipid phosphatase
LLGDLWYAGKTTVTDAVHIYSSPARLNQRTALVAAGLIAGGALIYAFEQDIHDAVRRSREDQPFRAILEVGREIEPIGHGGKTTKYYLGALTLGYLTGFDRLTWISADILESYYIAGGLKNLTNFVAARDRPFEGNGPNSFEFNGEGTSMPSGHTANVIQLARIASHHANWWPVSVVSYSLAGSIGLQRIADDAHWPSDVYFALIYGWLVADEIVRLNHARRFDAVPTVNDNGRLGLAVRVQF